jgi:integrase
MDEIERLLAMLRPTHWRIVAELQFRLGLRRCEVLALTSAWLDPRNGTVNVLVDEHFDTKSHRSRKIDGVDEVTFELAREVIALKGKLVLTASGYREAFERACERLARRGTPWLYGAKTHALRASYATASALGGIPLCVIASRMGHASQRTTEGYVGRTPQRVPGPFEGQERLRVDLPSLPAVALLTG